ncbi:MAG: GNAT family N-acetyltransferase [Caldilineales bacterium]|nr:GNAT family N-acetyltransferase [Caldilineales bacterium]
MSDLHLELTDAPPEADKQFLRQQIRAFNDDHSPPHAAVRQPGSVRPLCLFVRDADGALQGGLIAETYWGWLDIDILWLRQSRRGQGVGRQLLAQAEAEAVRRGCAWAQVKTFSFQAQAFYEKQGYRVVGEMRDYPPGASFLWMRKDL